MVMSHIFFLVGYCIICAGFIGFLLKTMNRIERITLIFFIFCLVCVVASSGQYAEETIMKNGAEDARRD